MSFIKYQQSAGGYQNARGKLYEATTPGISKKALEDGLVMVNKMIENMKAP